MRRVFVFGIGGTGSRVLRSLSMFMAAGIKDQGMDSDAELVPIIIDYDVVNGDKKIATDCLETYSRIHRSLDWTTPKGDSFFMTGISKLRDVATPGGQADTGIQSQNYDIYFGPETTSTQFSDLIKYDQMLGNLDATHSFFEALYNDLPEKDRQGNENKDTELNLNLKKGFKGNPNIGSVVFNHLKDTPEFKHFMNVFNPTQDKVFIISSIFGGTGSSGFPQIVNSIRFSQRPGLNNAFIGAVIALPYFKITNRGGAIDSNIFNSKTKAALSFYETSGLNNRVNELYYIGDNTTTNLDDHDGGIEQKNNAHIVEVLAALAIVDFFSKPINNINEALEYGIQEDATNLNLSNLYEAESVNLHFDYLTRLAYFVKYYRDVLQGKRKMISSKEAFYTGLKLAEKVGKAPLKDLEHFFTLFETWLEELANNQHAFNPYILDASKKLTKLLTHKPLQENKILPDDIRDADFTTELNDAFVPERANLKPTTELVVFFKIMRVATEKILKKAEKLPMAK